MTNLLPYFRGALLIGALSLMPALGAALHGQTPPRSSPAFEVASIKANRTGALPQRLEPTPGGRLTVTNVSLRGLVRFAYELQDFQIAGGPSWFAVDRFDIAAKAENDAPASELRLMLRALLAERFALRTHVETRDQPVYAMVMARSDGRLGPTLRPAQPDCSTQATSGVPFDRNAPCWPPGSFGPAPGTPITAGRLAFRAMTLDTFARSLAPLVGRVVINRTGLAGAYDAEFDATAELPPPPPPPGIANPFDPRAMPSVFTVLPDQLGLKLESTRAAIDVLVVDGAEHPADEP